MNNIQQIEELEKAFYSDGYRLGMQAVNNNNSNEELFTSIELMYSGIDEFIASVEQLAKQNNQPVDCKKGCEYCCYQPVFVLDFEMHFLSAFINNNLSKEKNREVRVRAESKRIKLAELAGEDLLNSKYACPLLENGVCLAYEARPMACRIYLSTSVGSCLTFYNNPGNRNSFPALLDLPMRAGRMMNEGFKAALKTNGIFAKELRIDEGLSKIS